MDAGTLRTLLIGGSVAVGVGIMAAATNPLAALRTIPAKIIPANFVDAAQTRPHTEKPPIRAGDIVFVGDSITEGGAWEELFPGAPVKNHGVGGDMTPGVLKRLEEITVAHPGKVFLMIGTNDLYVGRDQPTIVGNVREIVTRLRSASPETRIYLQSILPRETDRRAAVESLNRAFAEVAREQEIGWIDLYPQFLDEDGSMRNDLTDDEIHLTLAGYRVWRDQIQRFVDGPERSWKSGNTEGYSAATVDI